MVLMMNQSRPHLPQMCRQKVQARNASAQTVVKLATSKQTKSTTPPKAFCQVLEQCTNKNAFTFRLCPMLNGTMKQDEGFGSPAFTIGTADL